MIVFGLWLRLVLLATFVEALYAHVSNPLRLQASVSALGIKPQTPTAIAVTIADLVVCVLLVVTPTWGGVASLVYLLAVTVPILNAYRQGRAPSDCGCTFRPKSVDASFFVRNTGLGLASVLVAVGPESALADPALAIALVGLAGAVGLPFAVRRLTHAELEPASR
jgi:hypothetical protein